MIFPVLKEKPREQILAHSVTQQYSNLYVRARFAWENRHRQVFVCKKYKGANLTYKKKPKNKKKQEQSPYHNKLC